MTKNAEALRKLYRNKYIVGFLLLAGLACASLYINFQQTSDHEGRAELVDLATSQKALSQRISFFANALVNADNQVDRAILEGELNDAVNQMWSAHLTLSARKELSARTRRHLETVNEIYFNDYAPFDNDVRVFLLNADRLLHLSREDLDEARVRLHEVNILGVNTIMQTHDVITRIIAYETELAIAKTKRVQSILTALILILLVAESLLIFEPIGRHIEESMRDVELSNRVAQEEAVRAKAAHAAKTNFLRVMSHELRTPLNAVIGMSRLLKDAPLNHEQKAYLHHIGAAGEHMLSLADDILTINQHANGKLRLNPKPASVAEEVSVIVGMLRPKAADAGLALEFDEAALAGDVHHAIDRHRFRQVLINLIGNAVKFTEIGEVRVSYRCLPCEGDADHSDIEVRVSDTGVGVALEKREKIFEEFEQADVFSERSHGGAGLGLSISRKIVEAMGGRLTLESSSAAGSTFLISLKAPRVAIEKPVESGKADPLAAVQDEPKMGRRASDRKQTILIADDNLPNRMIAAAFLKKAGFEVAYAENGEQAVKAIKDMPDIAMIFMDVEMPVMDGIEATKAVRADEAGEGHKPIIALTAHALPEDRDNLLSSGFDDVLRKPASEEAITECARRHINAEQAA